MLGGKMAEGMQLSWQQTQAFCEVHERETSVIPLRLRDGFGDPIDFARIPKRLVVGWIGEELAFIADQPLRSTMFQEVQQITGEVGKSRWNSLERETSRQMMPGQ